jgi:hypothetical protein
MRTYESRDANHAMRSRLKVRSDPVASGMFGTPSFGHPGFPRLDQVIWLDRRSQATLLASQNGMPSTAHDSALSLLVCPLLWQLRREIQPAVPPCSSATCESARPSLVRHFDLPVPCSFRQKYTVHLQISLPAVWNSQIASVALPVGVWGHVQDFVRSSFTGTCALDAIQTV